MSRPTLTQHVSGICSAKLVPIDRGPSAVAFDATELIAELDGEPVGLGAFVVEHSELRACYVVPGAARRGVGTALVAEIERIAKDHRVEPLQLVASVNAECFYAALGYATVVHMLGGRLPMAAVKMAKRLD